MKKNEPSIIVALFFLAFSIGVISIMSIRTARTRGYAGWPWFFSFGGRASLKNTIEIPLEQADGLELEYGSKNIKIYPADDNKITIKEYLYSDRACAEVIYSADKKAKVTGKNHRSFVVFGFFAGEGERIEVYVPEKSLRELLVESGSGNVTSEVCAVREDGIFTVRAGSGNIRLSSAGGQELDFEANSGNVRVEEVTGKSIHVEAGSGNVDVAALVGEEIYLKTGSGNIKAEKLTGKNIYLKAGSGNITADVVDVTENMELRAGSGNVKLELPKEMAFHFSGNTGSGNIRTDFDEFLSYNEKGNHAEGDGGGGSPTAEISAETNSGNVRVLYQ